MPLAPPKRNRDGAVHYQTPAEDDLPTRPLRPNPVAIERTKRTKNDAQRLKWLRALGFSKLDKDGAFYPWWRRQQEFAENEIAFMQEFCGGFLGPHNQRLIGNASAQQALSGYFLELAMKAANEGDPHMAEKWGLVHARFGDYARTNFATAKEQGYKDGQAQKNMRKSRQANSIMSIAAEGDEHLAPGPELHKQMKTFPRADVREFAIEASVEPAPEPEQ